MWAALVLLLLYMLTVFLGSRVLDIVLWCTTEQGRQLVDPFLLSVRQLKQLLETRGVSHTGYIEKQELAQLVQDSGMMVFILCDSVCFTFYSYALYILKLL